MARIPDIELERLKNTISLTRLVEGAGIELKKSGKDLIGLCPFHEEQTPSLVISETKNVFHCFGCNASGTVIDWVMKTQGISFRHAIEFLQSDLPASSSLASPSKIAKRSSRKILDTIEADHADQVLLNHVIDFYHQTLLQDQEALANLEKRGLGHRELIERFKLGFANRTLGYRLVSRDSVAGKQQRAQLQKVGILRESGHEHLNGSIVIPIFDKDNNVVQAYGRKIIGNLRAGTPKHLYLPGPHQGIFNRDGIINQKEVILCEALIDALTFYQSGYTNVTSSFGVNGFTDELLQAFKENKTQRVLIAYDRDSAGDNAANDLAKKLNQENIDCYRINFPKGMDANSYALSVQPAVNSLGIAIRNAESILNAPKRVEEKANAVTTPKQNFEQQIKVIAAQVEAVNNPPPAKLEPQPAAAVPDAPTPINAEITDHEVVFTFASRRYRVRGLQKNLSYEVLKINLLASEGERVYVDTFDLYNARHRNTYIKQAANELELDEAIVKKDVGKLLLQLELQQEQQISDSQKPKESTVTISEDEKQSALALLKSPDLLNKIRHDFKACGIVGEDTNTITGYLACVSRKLDAPLAIIVQSTSAAGKSSLMDAVLNLMPEEDKVQYAAMTGQSLFYMGESDLKHKILAIVEEEGAHQASYALKLLQSEGQLTIASTGKDPNTGRLETQEYRVEGPVMLFLTTTAIEIDDELLNRCLVLTVNEERSQTQAIHQLQRKKRTLDGLLQKENKKTIFNLHRNAQRLLKPLHVVNPYAEQLTFLDDRTRTRRDHEKYLTLIDSITLLHQYQRKQLSIQRGEGVLNYIEVSLDDIAIANQLAHDILGRTLDELPPQTRRLLKQVYQMVKTDSEKQAMAMSDYRFNRKTIRDYTHWGDTQLRVHLDRLVSMEYILIHRGTRGQSYVYELLYAGQGDEGKTFLHGLINIETLKNTTTTESSRGKSMEFAGVMRPQSGADAGGSRVKKNGKNTTPVVIYENKSIQPEKSTTRVPENLAS